MSAEQMCIDEMQRLAAKTVYAGSNSALNDSYLLLLKLGLNLVNE